MSPVPATDPIVPRIAPVAVVAGPDAQILKVLMGEREPLMLFRVLARNPKVLARFLRGGLLDTVHLTMRQREVVIARTVARARAHYEWGVHVAEFSAAVGLTESDLSDLANTQAPLPASVWSASEQALATLCDALSSSGDVDDLTWRRVSSQLSDEALLEALFLNGYYTMVSSLVKTLRLAPEPGTSTIPDSA